MGTDKNIKLQIVTDIKMAKHIARMAATITQRCLTSPAAGQIRNSHAWKIGKLNHVAIAVTDLEKSIAMYRDVLGAKVSDPEPQEEHGVYTVFVELGETKIELL